MSFSANVKNELASVEVIDECCLKSELSALLRTNGHIKKYENQQYYIYFITENPAIARRIFKLLKSLYNRNVEVSVRRSQKLKKNMKYTVFTDDKLTVDRIIEDTDLLEKIGFRMQVSKKLPMHLLDNRCCKRAFLRGAFLGGGSMIDPEKTYHLEILMKGLYRTKDLIELLKYFDLEVKMVRRKEYYMIYIKESELVVDFLNIIGAHKALLELENIRALKGIRNDVNRIVNCETANLNKIVETSVRQVREIELIERELGLEELPKGLREVAIARLENPEIGMKDLGQILSKPIGKSGVNHRFRKITAIANELSKKSC